MAKEVVALWETKAPVIVSQVRPDEEKKSLVHFKVFLNRDNKSIIRTFYNFLMLKTFKKSNMRYFQKSLFSK